jgi:uncharacterized protein (TIGR04141 family)
MHCLIGECKLGAHRFILNEGAWYQVNDDFLQVIEDAIADIQKSNIDLPEYQDKNEGAYNKRAAGRDKNYFVYLDQNLIRYPRHGKVEVCDLYTKDKKFVHVKRCGASGTLSHLFSQGVVSAQLMVSERGFREQFRAKIPNTHYWGDPADPIKPSDFEVCYAIVNRPNKGLTLPFFSKVSLRTAARNLAQLGFRVSLASVPS